jgi:hypothetical protein
VKQETLRDFKMKQQWSYRHAVIVFLTVVGSQSGAATILPLLNGKTPRQFSVGVFFAVCMLGGILLATKALLWMMARPKVERENNTVT